MNKSTHFYRDIVISVFFILGMLGFMSGEFILSTTLFAASSLISNINFCNDTLQS
jgi:CheY-specific phosphatase CheX